MLRCVVWVGGGRVDRGVCDGSIRYAQRWVGDLESSCVSINIHTPSIVQLADVKSFPIPHPYPKKSKEKQHRMDKPYSFIEVCVSCRFVIEASRYVRRSQIGRTSPHIHIHIDIHMYLHPNQTLFYVRGTVIMSIWPQILLGLILVRIVYTCG